MTGARRRAHAPRSPPPRPGGTYADPSAGDPIQYDELRIEHDQGAVEIVVYNRAIPLFTADSEASRAFDSRTGQAILDLLRELNRATQLTVILATHSPVAASYGHRVVELRDGRIVREGSSPASETAAG